MLKRIFHILTFGIFESEKPDLRTLGPRGSLSNRDMLIVLYAFQEMMEVRNHFLGIIKEKDTVIAALQTQVKELKEERSNYIGKNNDY